MPTPERDPYRFQSLFSQEHRSQNGSTQHTARSEDHGADSHCLASGALHTSCMFDRGGAAEQHSAANISTGAGQHTCQEHLIVHMQAGEVYRAFIRLVHKAAAEAQTQDESMPSMSADQAPYRYIIVRAGQQRPPQKGFCSDMAPGMIARRVCITKPAFHSLQIQAKTADMEKSMCANTGLVAVQFYGYHIWQQPVGLIASAVYRSR